jgi:hypothetical protein
VVNSEGQEDLSHDEEGDIKDDELEGGSRTSSREDSGRIKNSMITV